MGPRLGSRAGRRARAPHARGGRALRRDADARRLAHEAPARRRAGDDLRRAARARGGHAGRDDADPRLHGGGRSIPREAAGGVHRCRPRAAAPDHGQRRRRPAPLATDDVPAARARAAAHLPGRVLGLRRHRRRHRQLVHRARPRPHAARNPRVARALRAVLDPRDGVRLLAGRPLSEVPRLARHLSRRPARRPARHAVALEDRVPAAARDSGDRLRVRPRRRLDRGRDPLVVRRPRGRARALGFQNLGTYCVRFQVQTLAYLLLLTDRYPTLASGSGFQFERGES